jgi:release factor glutamine methyltransferase
VLDIGVGTGAIGLALLSHYPNISCHGLDINPLATNLALINAKTLSLDTRYSCDTMSFMDHVSKSADIKYDVIISNPPYIPSDEMQSLQTEVGQYEDHRALHGGEDGLDIIRDIITHGHTLLNRAGSNEIWLEVARQHPGVICEWVRSDPYLHSVYSSVTSIDDFTGNPRFVRLKKRV